MFDGVRLKVGPESAGSEPGPASYGLGGPLAITDMNLFLGRIPDHYFPFPLNLAIVKKLLIQMSAEVLKSTGIQKTPEQLA